MSSQSYQSAKLKITLEEVLRLKRREKPSAEFWDQFDRELRQKTLRALVEEKSWPQRYLTPVFGRVAIALPLAAAAVLALVFTVFQNEIFLGESQSSAPAYTSNTSANEGFAGNALPVSSPANQAVQASMPAAFASMTVYSRVNFVVTVIPLPSDSQRNFDTIMTPQTLTASTGFGNMYQDDPMASNAPLVKFVSAPTLDYF